MASWPKYWNVSTPRWIGSLPESELPSTVMYLFVSAGFHFQSVSSVCVCVCVCVWMSEIQ